MQELLLTHPTLIDFFKTIIIEVMLGYSDSERISGMCALNIVATTLKAVEDLINAFGLASLIFHGPGGDVARGGAKLRPQIFTAQGELRSHMLGTKEMAVWFRETQFYHAYKNISQSLNPQKYATPPTHIQNWIDEFIKTGCDFYEMFHDCENGLGKLMSHYLGRGGHPFVAISNSSSRATTRDSDDIRGDRTSSVQSGGLKPKKYLLLSDLRAITAVQIKEVLRDYLDVLIGPGYGFRSLGLDRAIRIYDSSEVVRDIFHKLLFGIAMADFSMTKHALFFGSGQDIDLTPKNPEQRVILAQKCNDLKEQLKRMDVKHLSETDRGKDLALTMLAKFFEIIVDEAQQTQEFVFKMLKRIYPQVYRIPGQPGKESNWLILPMFYCRFHNGTRKL